MVTWTLPSSFGEAEPCGGDHVIEQRHSPPVVRKQMGVG